MIKTLSHKYAAGTTLVTMMCGHIVEVRIDELIQDSFGPAYKCTFLRHYATTMTRLCLDLGQNWYINAGDKEQTEDRYIDRAIELVKGA